MLNESEKKNLIEQLKKAKEEVNLLKSKLSKVNSEKESWFRKKATISQEIKDKISFVQDSKKQRNNLTSEVKSTKTKRDELNKKISEELKIVKHIKPKPEDGHHQQRENPFALKKKIDSMELKIETEPMSFQKEQAIMKEIKTLKKKYDEIKGLMKEIDDIRGKNKELNMLKKEANKFHKDLQQQAKESQEFHEQIIEYSKEIDILREKEKEAHDKFMLGKDEYINLNNELKRKLEELKAVKDNLEQNEVRVEELEREKKHKNLKEKTKEVNEKIKKKQKLTTEDLLIMQSSK
ncbi:MAG: hypothetical protein KJ583_04975 [Nanoarchaeota archaeon]|nr:hypothetical protein [Nanoarchaeota archaeon]MBU1270371.1 hypothetical protein [Nanoarchaeota archaeon]MBU1604642.1 hypothetical protein [Nanoarchaeota archaeon]MBU2442643.1 hypothetical protein [Nanoarchaeota archaeon]